MTIQDRIKKLVRVPAGELLPNPKNWRQHPEKQRSALSGVLSELGWADAVLARETADGLMLIDGHLRTEVAPESEIPVLVLDVSEDEADKILLTHDPLADMAETNAAALDSLMRDVNTGSEGVQEMLAELADSAGLYPEITEQSVTEDEVPEPPKKAVVKEGEIWQLGSHRLMCGDCCDESEVSLLMNGNTASMVFADPPYGIKYQSNMRTASEQFDVIDNDDQLLSGWIPIVCNQRRGFVFIWTAFKVFAQWQQLTSEIGSLSNVVIWFKKGGGIGDLKKTFLTDYEMALVYHRGAELKGKRIGSVWEIKKDFAGDYQHPTQKPVALAARAMQHTTNPTDLILDPFLGSGTTLIAAEQLGRECYGMEISPQYCDVIIERWQNLTGQKAKRVTDGN